ncbi:MAG: SusE domain-containing protein [Bacteroidetes bacterium]|nr:SusE domain-containing protein [Bacteroidota bacterium]
MKYLFAITSLLLVITSCKKDLTTATLISPSGPSKLTASSTNLVLSSSNDSIAAISFSWPAPNYGVAVPVTYTLLIDQPSDTSGATAWSNAKKITIATDSLKKSWLGTDFNVLLNQLGLTPGIAAPIVVRLKADVNQSTGTASVIPTLSSDVSMTVTPYKIVLIYPKLYAAGDFLTPNWTQIDQPGWVVASLKSDNNYEGYINFPNTDNNFKLCTQLSWNGTNYGWGTSATTMSTTGGNLYFSGPGYCRVSVDVTALTISYTPTNWFVSGDFNNWSTTAGKMTFNASTNQWTVTGVAMTAGNHFKFAGDPSWNSQYGVDSKGNLASNGGDIIAAKTGTFTVTLDLSQGAGNYTYSVK